MYFYAVRDDVGRYAFFVDWAREINHNGWYFEYNGVMCHNILPDLLVWYDDAQKIKNEIGGEIITFKIEEYIK